MFHAQRYLDVTDVASPYISREHLKSYPATPEEMPKVGTCVYIAFDGVGVCRYVGSTQRSEDALRKRLAEHRRDRPFAWQWTEIWVVEMIDTLPRKTLEHLEARIGAFMEPTDNHRLPSLGTARQGTSVTATP